MKWSIGRLQKAGMPVVVYLHPREVDPEHPRLPLRLHRRFKSYVNLGSTVPKLKWLCENYKFQLMKDFKLTPVKGEEKKVQCSMFYVQR